MMTKNESTQERPLFYAMEIYEAYIADFPVRAENERDDIQDTVLMIGQHLADIGHPGDWSQLQVGRFFQQIDYLEEPEKLEITHQICCLYMWLSLMDGIIEQECADIVAEMKKCCPPIPFLLASLDTAVEIILDKDKVSDKLLN